MDKRPDLYRFSRGKRKCVDQKMFKEVHTGAYQQPSLMALQFDDGQVCKLCFCPVIVCKKDIYCVLVANYMERWWTTVGTNSRTQTRLHSWSPKLKRFCT